MKRGGKTQQLQIRVSATEKAAIRHAAARAGLDISAYVLTRVHAVARREFEQAVATVAARDGEGGRYALADLNRLLSAFTAAELCDAVAAGVASARLSEVSANYVAAMVETACARRGVPVPAWTREIRPLLEPLFGSALHSLRLHLLTQSPAPFRRRNIFIDASVGDQV